MLLSDGYIANGSEPWRIPDVASLPKIDVRHPTKPNDPAGFMPFKRDERLVRPWAVPGTPGLEHRIGGLEKEDISGRVSYDSANHERMVRLRHDKVAGIQPAGQPLIWTGPEKGEVLLVSWGGTYGAVKAATLAMRAEGMQVSACHLRYLNPLPAGLADMFREFDHVILPELNLGQLRTILRAHTLIDIQGINKVKGQPFAINELVDGVRAIVSSVRDAAMTISAK